MNLVIQTGHHYVASRILTQVHSKVTKYSNNTQAYNLNYKRKFIIYLIDSGLCQVQYVGKAETAFNIRLNNHRKDVNNLKSILVVLHFIKSGHSFNVHAKFIWIKKLSNGKWSDLAISKKKSKQIFHTHPKSGSLNKKNLKFFLIFTQ